MNKKYRIIYGLVGLSVFLYSTLSYAHLTDAILENDVGPCFGALGARHAGRLQTIRQEEASMNLARLQTIMEQLKAIAKVDENGDPLENIPAEHTERFAQLSKQFRVTQVCAGPMNERLKKSERKAEKYASGLQVARILCTFDQVQFTRDELHTTCLFTRVGLMKKKAVVSALPLIWEALTTNRIEYPISLVKALGRSASHLGDRKKIEGIIGSDENQWRMHFASISDWLKWFEPWYKRRDDKIKCQKEKLAQLACKRVKTCSQSPAASTLEDKIAYTKTALIDNESIKSNFESLYTLIQDARQKSENKILNWRE